MILKGEYSGGDKSSSVVVYTITRRYEGWVPGDEPTREISTADLVWEFFKNHRKR